MSVKPGAATGPQKRPRREAAVEQTQQGPQEAEDAVDRRDDRTRARMAWDSLLQRLSEETQRIQAALEGMPAGESVMKVEDLPMPDLMRVEQDLTGLRVQVEQAGSAVL